MNNTVIICLQRSKPTIHQVKQFQILGDKQQGKEECAVEGQTQ